MSALSMPRSAARRSAAIRVRFTDDEHAAICARAEAEQRSVSEFVRLSLLTPPPRPLRPHPSIFGQHTAPVVMTPSDGHGEG